MRLPLLLLLIFATLTSYAAEIRGKVTNAVGGEALESVEVAVLGTSFVTNTSLRGEFSIPHLPPGSYTLRLNAVGYRLLAIPFTLASESETKDFSVTMVPDNFRRTDQIEVHADIFQVADSPTTPEMNLISSEIRQTSTVLADDPFRAVQTLPGVSAEGNNEFFGEFSVMGAPFSNVAVYIDDVLVLNPFHEIGNFSEGASLGILTSEVVEEMKLLPAAFPERFADADGAALDIHTRDGSRTPPLFRITAGIAASEFLGEGWFRSSRKGSWLVSARKSYLNYLVHGRVQNAADVGFEDAALKLTYDLTPRQNLSLFATDGHTSMSMSDQASLAREEYASGASDFTLARAGWRWAVAPPLFIDAHAAYIREPDSLYNNLGELLTRTDHREWVVGSNLSWAWSHDHVLQAGLSERRIRDSEHQVGITDMGDLQPFSFFGKALRQSAYVQQASTLLHGRVHLLGSVRWDRFHEYLPQRFSPQLSLSIEARRTTQLQFAAGRYAQYSNSAFGPPPDTCLLYGFLPSKSEHYSAAVEERLGDNARIRLEAFQRKNFLSIGETPSSQLTSQPCPVLQASLGGTYQRDYSHGVQLTLQRRSSNRLSGWIGYTFLKAQARQYDVTVPTLSFPFVRGTDFYYSTLEDQRHSLNLFATYRLRPTLSLSGKFLFGSGFPISSGTFIPVGNGQFIETGINTSRLDPYVRLDVRTDKDWPFDRWKLTLYGEVLNVTNHYNGRFAYYSAIDPNTGRVLVKTLQGLPITPTLGLTAQF
ncbi:MAG TPA: TonB-dependent receptor [Dongiaceae bacterium]|nr:TonB-dependent receptor [Dongiaceae bacterium]